MKVVEYLDQAGRSPFEKWFRRLDPQAAAKVTTVLYRIEQGNLSNAENLGAGIFEYKVDFGPGYRIYFGKEGKQLAVLVGGGTKKRQTQDIKRAKERWQEYKHRRRKSDIA